MRAGTERATGLPPEIGPDAHVADTVFVIEQLGLTPVILCGQSLGGVTALLVAARHPGPCARPGARRRKPGGGCERGGGRGERPAGVAAEVARAVRLAAGGIRVLRRAIRPGTGRQGLDGGPRGTSRRLGGHASKSPCSHGRCNRSARLPHWYDSDTIRCPTLSRSRGERGRSFADRRRDDGPASGRLPRRGAQLGPRRPSRSPGRVARRSRGVPCFAPYSARLAEEVAVGRHDELGRRAVACDAARPRTTTTGQPVVLAMRRGRRRRRARRRPRPASRAARSRRGRRVPRRSTQRRDARRRRSRRRSCPGGTARPNESVTITADVDAGQLAQRARGCARALASGSSGSRTTVPGSGAFEWSTPAEAQTKPCRVSAITSGGRARTIRAVSRRIDLDLRAGRSLAGELARPVGRLDVVERDDAALGLRDRLLRDDDARRRPRARRARRSARRGRRPRRSRAGPRPGRSRSRRGR